MDSVSVSKTVTYTINGDGCVHYTAHPIRTMAMQYNVNNMIIFYANI